MDRYVVLLTLTDAFIAQYLLRKLEASGVPAISERIQLNGRGKLLAAAYRLLVPADLRREAYAVVRNSRPTELAPIQDRS